MTTDPPWGASKVRDCLLQTAREVEREGNHSYALANHLAVTVIDVLDWAWAWAAPSRPDPVANGFPGKEDEAAVVVPEIAARIAGLRSVLGLSDEQFQHQLRSAYVYFRGHHGAWVQADDPRSAPSFELVWRCLEKALAAQGPSSSPTHVDPD